MESDCTVGARTTSASRHRRGHGRGRLGRVRGSLRHQRHHRVGPGAAGGAAKAFAEPERCRVGDDEDVLALADAHAVADDVLDRASDVGCLTHPATTLAVAALRLYIRRAKMPAVTNMKLA